MLVSGQMADKAASGAATYHCDTAPVVHEQSVPVTARFSAPGPCHLALYANGERVGHRPLAIGKVG